MVWSIEQGLVSRSTTDWMDTRYRAYVAGKVSELQICGEMVQIYSGLREQELRAAAARYFNELVRPHIFTEVAALVAKLRKANVELWAVSSTNKWVVSEGVRDHSASPKSACWPPKSKSSMASSPANSSMFPPAPQRPQRFAASAFPHPDAVFGNSLHDLAMLEIAAHPFPVNPSSALLEECAKRGWGYFRPREVAEAPAPVAGE